MTAPTNVAKRDEPKMMDVNGAKASVKFLDAYNGRLEKMSTEQQSMFLMALGQRLGVRAELGELILYQGKPYISIDGRLRLAHETGLLVGLDTRPATPRERQDFGAEDGEALWVCSAWRRGSARAFTGWGHVSKADRNPVSKQFPREMAKKRAKYDALRSAFPPAEQISELHTRYIEEAEQEIREQRVGAHPLLEASYGEERAEETAEDVGGHEAAADAEVTTSDLQPSLDITTPTPRRGNTNALAQP